MSHMVKRVAAETQYRQAMSGKRWVKASEYPAEVSILDEMLKALKQVDGISITEVKISLGWEIEILNFQFQDQINPSEWKGEFYQVWYDYLVAYNDLLTRWPATFLPKVNRKFPGVFKLKWGFHLWPNYSKLSEPYMTLDGPRSFEDHLAHLKKYGQAIPALEVKYSRTPGISGVMLESEGITHENMEHIQEKLIESVYQHLQKFVEDAENISQALEAAEFFCDDDVS